MLGPTVKVQRFDPARLFCLNLIDTGIAAYFAAVHPDFGIPVYQEMEYLLTTGASCGDTMKHTYDNVVMGEGGKRPSCPRFEEGKPSPLRTPRDVMLYGTAARVLFGDPTAHPVDRVSPGPFTISVEPQGTGYVARVQLVNPLVKYSLQDTFHSHLSADKRQFNDRIYVRIPLPGGKTVVEGLQVHSARAEDKELTHELLASAVEELDGKTYLHVQVDFATRGYQISAMRNPKTELVLTFQ